MNYDMKGFYRQIDKYIQIDKKRHLQIRRKKSLNNIKIKLHLQFIQKRKNGQENVFISFK